MIHVPTYSPECMQALESWNFWSSPSIIVWHVHNHRYCCRSWNSASSLVGWDCVLSEWPMPGLPRLKRQTPVSTWPPLTSRGARTVASCFLCWPTVSRCYHSEIICWEIIVSWVTTCCWQDQPDHAVGKNTEIKRSGQLLVAGLSKFVSNIRREEGKWMLACERVL